MQTLSMRKMSLLGLVLLAASAVTAAIMPKDKTDKQVAGYSLDVSTGCNGQVTCSITDNPAGAACNHTGTSSNNSTAGSGTSWTTGGDHLTEPGNGTAEGQNTSQSPC